MILPRIRVLPFMLCGLLFFPSGLPSQTRKCDSLRHILAAMKRDNGKKLGVMIDLAAALRGVRPDQGRSVAEDAVRLARKIHDEIGEARSLYRLGITHIDAKDYARGRECMSLSEEICEHIQFKEGIGAAFRGFGVIEQGLGNFEKSIDWSRKALKYAEEAKDSLGQASSLTNIGISFHSLRQHEEALDYFKKSLAIFEAIGYTQGIAGLLINIGACTYHADHKDMMAIGYLERGLAIAETSDQLMWQYNALSNLGDIYSNAGDYKQGLTCYKRSLTIAEGMGNELKVTQALNKIGEIHSSSGNYKDALEWHERSLQRAQMRGDAWEVASALKDIGSAYSGMGEYEKALDYSLLSLRQSEQNGDQPEIAETLNVVGSVFTAKKDYQKAIEFFERSRVLSERLDEKSTLANALDNLGSIYMEMGDNKHAMALYQKSIRLREALADKPGLVRTYNNIGVLYERSGESAEALTIYQRSLQGSIEVNDKKGIARALNNIGGLLLSNRRFSHALAYFDSAIVIADTLGLKDIRCALLGNKSQYYASMCEYQKAWELYREHVQLKDSLLNESNTKSMNELFTKYESVKKEQLIALLEKDKALQASELERRRKELALRQLEAEHGRKEGELLARRHQIQSLELKQRTTDLELRTKERDLQKSEKEEKAHKLLYQASVIDREMLFRNALIVGLCLSLVIGYLFFRRLEGRKREIALRAEAAEYIAQAAEAHANALRADAERKEKEAQKLFTALLIESQEQERKRVSSELHDSISQDLIVIRNRALNAIKENVPPERIREHVNEIVEMASVALGDVRHISRALRPYQIDQIGLTETLRQTVGKAADASPLRFTIEIGDIDGVLPQDAEINLFRLVQEAVNNILKHSQATAATVFIARSDDMIRATVADNGKGFDARAVLESSSSAGLGLRSMTERVQMLGGKLHIGSSPGNGTTIDATVPVGVNALSARSLEERFGVRS